ncbi:MAG TPA: dihydrolipoamide acetyltransferase family protein [Actinomycetes bacterium]|nr:dihydrolipoamide acetyltransferase family protein [Actinomycetes bacterium]
MSSTPFRMPTLGADMESGTLLEWLVQPGDEVHRGQVVAVIDTAKSAIDIESWDDGVVERLLVQPGTTVAVGTPLALLTTTKAPEATASGTDEPAPPAARAATVPRARSAPPASPVVRRLADRLGVDLASVAGTGKDGRVTHADVEAAAQRTSARAGGTRRASPLARRRAAERGVDLASVRGTGPSGAVLAADIERAPSADRPGGEPPPRPGGLGPEDRAAAMRAAIGALMSRSKQEIPHYYLAHTVDVTSALARLQSHNAGLPVAARVLPAALFLRATALAARRVPEVNGFFVDGSFHPSAAVHLGVAVNLRGGGLVTPALHDADDLGLDDLMAALRDLVARARAGHLRRTEMSDGTLTVTNLGERGVELVHGVIVPPQVGLVGFGSVVRRPWAVDDMLTVRSVVTVTFSGDHRAGDGHLGARFLSALDELMQRPEEL